MHHRNTVMKSVQPAHFTLRQFQATGKSTGISKVMLGWIYPMSVPTKCLTSARGKAFGMLRWEIRDELLRIETSSEAPRNATDTIRESEDIHNKFPLC